MTLTKEMMDKAFDDIWAVAKAKGLELSEGVRIITIPGRPVICAEGQDCRVIGTHGLSVAIDKDGFLYGKGGPGDLLNLARFLTEATA